MSEYELKILGRPGRPGYLWLEGQGVGGRGSGFFQTVPLTPKSIEDWREHTARRNAEAVARQSSNPDPLGLGAGESPG